MGPCDSSTWALSKDGRTDHVVLGPGSPFLVSSRSGGGDSLPPGSRGSEAVFSGSLLVSCAFTISRGRPSPATARAVEDPDPGLS